MGDSAVRLLPRDQWLTLDRATWRASSLVLLCSDQPDPSRNRRILHHTTYRPDTFTVADRAGAPAWLAPEERAYRAWLHGLVTRRLAAIGGLTADTRLQQAAARHTLDQVERLLDQRLPGGTVAQVLYNQEVPYVVDRVIGHSLLGDATADLDHHRRYRSVGHALVADLLNCHGGALAGLDVAVLIRLALRAGLVALDMKGGRSPCAPITVAGFRPGHPDTVDGVWRHLTEPAGQPAVDHTATFLAAVESGPVRLVWFLDDLIETAFDLLVMQRLVIVNPRLAVHIVPRRGRHDNDASDRDVDSMLRLPALARLASTVADGRTTVSRHGPAMATANPLKFAPELVKQIATADVVFVKGGRNDELLAAQLTAPTVTGYVVVREFTESIAGLDARDAPSVLVATGPGQPAWWGFRGRAHRHLPVGQGRTVPACHSTVAEHHRRTTTHDPGTLRRELAALLDHWPTYTGYEQPARIELRLLRDRLATTSPHDSQLLLSAADTRLADP